ncbi:GNAT family N-acetyltransferase [Rhodobacteraceae bacterium B1Z28]|uniref:GNAT family N-acetyltransferase n=1 Tax=Ruegeria haliotis TaxID=2747601 RepID=A0ABX2PMR9_9RHOB|nr:GNAT family N-acetyltransferase [Ruegeria haliotis]NVO54557.1 GNAT family N-acetyltransferase [Ruegeria haliotis]
MSDYIIRPLTPDELQNAVDWAGREGWNPGHHDATCFRTTDPDGFLGGFLDGEMIASVSAVNYDDVFSFLGFYIVRPEYRGSGHGLEIAQHALAHCTGRNMGLDGVVEQQDNYRKSGFTFAYNNYRFSGTVAGIQAKLGPAGNTDVAEITDASADLIAYDRHLFPAPRDAFLRSWLNAPSHTSRMYSGNGKIQGYATLRPCQTGYKIGPLFADDAGIAQALLASLMAAIPAGHSGSEVFIDMPQPNDAAFALAAQLGLDKVFETARMYSDHEPDIDLSRIYGVTTFELG